MAQASDEAGAAPALHAATYSPNWVERLGEAVSRLPGPAWLYYVAGWLVLWVLLTVLKWLDGSVRPGEFTAVVGEVMGFSVYFLAAMHYLDQTAQRVPQQIPAALLTDQKTYDVLSSSLSHVPARPVLYSAMFMSALQVMALPFNVELMRSTGLLSSLPVALFGIAFVLLNSSVLGAFAYYLVYRLRVVSQFTAAMTKVDLFQPQPLYALSMLTAQMALVLIGFAALAVFSMPTITPLLPERAGPLSLRAYAAVSLLTISVISPTIAVLVFAYPLWQAHHTLVAAKLRLRRAANQHLEAALALVHSGIDTRDLHEMDALNKAINSLALERDLVDKSATWPWPPDTLRILATALLLPVVLWVIQRVLERFLLT